MSEQAQEGIAGTIECATHGPMHYRVPLKWWECVGFDGEGCGTQILYDEDVCRCLRSQEWPPGVVIRWKAASNAAGPQEP